MTGIRVVQVISPEDLVEADPTSGIHRETNPGDEPSVAVIARAGGGIPTVNVEAPPGR